MARHLIGEDSTVEKEYLVRVVWDSPEGRVEHDISKVFPEELLEKLNKLEIKSAIVGKVVKRQEKDVVIL